MRSFVVIPAFLLISPLLLFTQLIQISNLGKVFVIVAADYDCVVFGVMLNNT